MKESDTEMFNRLEVVAPRVTEEHIKSIIVSTAFHRLTDVLTVCVLTLLNGFSVRGESACASPENYRQELGEKFAYEDAVRKVWPLEGYLLKQKLYEASLPPLAAQQAPVMEGTLDQISPENFGTPATNAEDPAAG